MEWKPIKTCPTNQDVLVCVTFNIGGDDELETVYWVDAFLDYDGCAKWKYYHDLIHAPFPPTHWMPLPSPPIEKE